MNAPVRVLFFSVLRDAVGTPEVGWSLGTDLPAPCTAGDVLETAIRRWPALAAWRGRCLIAVNLEFATPDTTVVPGSEVALMPPVQGG